VAGEAEHRGLTVARRRQDVTKTYLCAVKFWSGAYDRGSGGYHSSKPQPDGGGLTPLRAGVRHVVRKQGFSPAEMNRAERALLREGKIEQPHRNAVRITAAGRRVSCRTTKLTPWTDKGYPANTQFAGSRRRKRR
jgi:hypothetical protein